ncbi:uncharacterized protein PG998_002857 [Apiospora kogelbergensis]|uniref:uncharacterized protein n=1 Tax=Apiospora kogelbergensis TaxID=1337665 RepID=UPI00312E3B36
MATSKPVFTPDGGIGFISNDLAAFDSKREEREQESPAVSTVISNPVGQTTRPIHITTAAEEGVEKPRTPKCQRRSGSSTMAPPTSKFRDVRLGHTPPPASVSRSSLRDLLSPNSNALTQIHSKTTESDDDALGSRPASSW